MVDFLFLSPREFLHSTFRLGRKVYQSGFRPKHVVSIWRGGTPVGLGVDAFFRSRGIFLRHSTIATESYSGIRQQGEVIVKGLDPVIETICPEDGLLLVDDVLETGHTIERVLEILSRRARANLPEDIRVATLHHKPDRNDFKAVPVVCLEELPATTWIVYPHELSDLVRDDDPTDRLILEKDAEVWSLLREETAHFIAETGSAAHLYLTPEELLLDALRLGQLLVQDAEFHPDYLVALWPGGIHAGLPVHEVYRYKEKKGGRRAPDHISLNTFRTRRSYRSDIVGLNYLAEHINQQDSVLLIDTTFRSGRVINDALLRLKEVLRRNLTLENVRVAAVYYHPTHRATWTVPPTITQPHYFVREVDRELIYPSSIHRLANPAAELERRDPALEQILFGKEADE
jgi:hypothetical protein